MADEGTDEFFDVIDEKGKVLGKERRSAVHRKGLLHKGAYMFVLNGKGQIFIQKRSGLKDFFPGRWDMSAAEHLKLGESYEGGAARGLKEELGIENASVEKIGEKEYHFKSEKREDNEINHVFKASFEGEIKLDSEEVSEGKWIERQELLKEMEKEPEKFTPWLLNCKDLVEKL
ncbi:MAG: NUDIX domain-containing protein [Candidatus Diapherotrites archaeon]|uniref:NUDIX domain-containing protein n=1 Tax=Candidatus Iainarchaeum sp. TaxID=3101447 RepID=A0A938YTB0_9ARCH|nr:NUDIX domain-containing protein [Candidatus Diapherotrites archaeon]